LEERPLFLSPTAGVWFGPDPKQPVSMVAVKVRYLAAEYGYSSNADLHMQ
jgi:hypothetical protein